MFTGLIETVGTVKAVAKKSSDIWLIEIEAPEISSELRIGDSVSVLGACLTVVSFNSSSFSVEMMDETMHRTKLGNLKSGSKVNLERAMRIDARLDGHIVAGHVDGTATVIKADRSYKTIKFFFGCGKTLLEGIVPKGSVAIDGVSLTVIDVTDRYFSVELIPTTISKTTLSDLKQGDTVNIETDIIGKYVIKIIVNIKDNDSPKESLTWDKLSSYGWT